MDKQLKDLVHFIDNTFIGQILIWIILLCIILPALGLLFYVALGFVWGLIQVICQVEDEDEKEMKWKK